MEYEQTSAAGTPGATTKKFKAGEITRAELIGPGSATISNAATGIMTITASVADFEHLEIKTTDESMKVEFHGGVLRNRAPEGPIRYELAVLALTELKCSGGVAAEAVNLESHKLSVDLKDGSTLSLSGLRAVEFDAKIADEGRITVSGAVQQQKVKVSGKSVYQAQGLECAEVEIEAADGSEATVNVGKRLKAKATGGSTVAYTGDKIDLAVQTSDGSVFRHLAD